MFNRKERHHKNTVKLSCETFRFTPAPDGTP